MAEAVVVDNIERVMGSESERVREKKTF